MSFWRMLDSADLYYNHAAISAALKSSLPALGLAREDIFLITKLRPSDLGETRCRYCRAAQLAGLHYLLQVRRAPLPGGAGGGVPGPAAGALPLGASRYFLQQSSSPPWCLQCWAWLQGGSSRPGWGRRPGGVSSTSRHRSSNGGCEELSTALSGGAALYRSV